MKAERSILELQDVTKHFGGLNVIENLSFAVARGSRTAMIGPNGGQDHVVQPRLGAVIGGCWAHFV